MFRTKKVYSIKILLVSFLLVGSFSCNKESDPIVLKVGEYELRNSIHQALLLKNNKNTGDLSFQNELVDNAYVMAYAIDKQYDTISFLNKQLEYIARFYASTVEGYVWNKKVKPSLKIDENELREVYRKRAVSYGVNLIQIPNEEILSKYMETQGQITTVEEFDVLKNLVAGDPKVKCFSQSVYFPFYPYGTYLSNEDFFKVGNVIGPIETLNGYFLIHVDGVKKEVQQPYEQVRSILEQELIFGLREKFIWESQKEIFKATNPAFKKDAIDELASGFDKNTKSWPTVDTESVLMEYKFLDEKMVFRVRDFIEFVHHQPVFRGDLSDPNDVEKMMRSFLIGKYLYQEALDMGMERDEEFIQFMQMRKQGVFIHHFKKEKVLPEIKLSESDVEDYYQNNISEFQCFGNALVTVYKYSDIQLAMESRSLIQEQTDIPRKRNSVDGVNIRIDMPQEQYEMPIIEAIINLNQGELSMPVKQGETYWLIKLNSKSGAASIPYALVRNQAEQALLKQKEHEIYNKQLSLLKKKYQVVLNPLDFQVAEIRY